ncbi:MAG: hypothetical protein K2P78_03755 [Gemmataceae bacterium]|nr:hypothetical protein [Gemmataceae bacterium]
MRPAVVVLGVPVAVGLVAAVPAGLLLGPWQWTAAGVAFGLTVPPGLVALAAARYLIRMSPLGRVLAMFVGLFVRLVAALGGGLVAFLILGPDSRADKIAFWAWLLFAYLVTLAAETAVFAHGRPGTGAADPLPGPREVTR